MAAESAPILTTIIASGIAGSFLTIVVSKILDFFEKRREHRYSLQNVFFGKQMEVAEVVVCHFEQTIAIIEGMTRILRKVMDLSATDLSSEFMESQLKAFRSWAQEMEQRTDKSYYAASLYFDTERLDRITSLCSEKILNTFVLMGLIDKRIKAIGSSTATKEDAEALVSQLVEVLKDFAATEESLKAAMREFMQDVRGEMRVHRP